MSLLFAGNGDRVDYTIGNITAGTLAGWFYITDDTQRQGFYQYGSTDEWGLEWRADVANDVFQGYAFCGTTYSNFYANATSFAVYALNKWLFIAIVFQRTSPAATDNKLYMGDLTTVLAEPSSYATQTAGTGTPGTGAATMRLGNAIAATTREFRGRIAWFGRWSRILTLAELTDQQFRPHVTSGCQIFSWVGFNGATNVPDWSGSVATGAVTGATLTPDHVPLGPSYGYFADWEGNFTAPAAVTFPWSLPSRNPDVRRPMVTPYF